MSDVLRLCVRCLAGQHGECEGEIDDAGEDTCDCTEGACHGEWVEIGYLDTDGLCDLRVDAASQALGTLPIIDLMSGRT